MPKEQYPFDDAKNASDDFNKSATEKTEEAKGEKAESEGGGHARENRDDLLRPRACRVSRMPIGPALCLRHHVLRSVRAVGVRRRL